MMPSLLLSLVGLGLAIMIVVMTASWLFQRKVGNAGWTDVFWTLGTGGCGIVIALWPDPFGYLPRQLLVAGLLLIWSLRLGLYVAFRVARSEHEDARYVIMRNENGARFQSLMFKLSLVQPPTSALLFISIALAAHQRTPWFRINDLAALAILAIAIGGEGLADAQMKRFKADPANKGKVIGTGLWAWSRHPNYFFEWVGWIAYPVMALRIADSWSWASLVAPIVMYQVLTKLTGVPPTEAALVRSKGEAYRRYQQTVSPFFPLPPKKATAK